MTTFYQLIILSTLFIYLISQTAFINGKPTCNHFLINTYLYLALSLCILGLSIYGIQYAIFGDETDYFKLVRMVGPYFLPLFVVSLGLIIFIAMTPTFEKSTIHVARNHAMWALFIASMALMLAPRVMSKELSPYVNSSIFIVALIFTVMSALVYAFPSFFGETYQMMRTALLLSLIVVIILEIANLFSSDMKSFMERRRWLSYVVIVIFSLYISYDTQRVLMLADICKNFPNYPKTSVSFFLDVVNLFSRVLFLSSGK